MQPMTRFLGNWEVETDIVLPEGLPFIRYDHPSAQYSVFFRNIPAKQNDLTYLSMQVIFDAPSLTEAKTAGERVAKEFLDHLCFVSNLKARLRDILQIFNWEPGTPAMREALYFSRGYAHDDAPYEALDQRLLDTIAILQAQPISPRLRRALKWFGNGVASAYRDDQFAYFWFVVELVAQLIKNPTPVPDKCPTCHGPLYCNTCGATPLHRPYPKQAIEQLFAVYVTDDPEGVLYNRANSARNMLMHGEEVSEIEAALKIDFSELVDQLGRLAWTAILNQFIPVLLNKHPSFLQTSRYVHINMAGTAHIQIGFIANFNNPDPAHFPTVELSMVRTPRNKPTQPPPGIVQLP
jgi:hypothetical protein